MRRDESEVNVNKTQLNWEILMVHERDWIKREVQRKRAMMKRGVSFVVKQEAHLDASKMKILVIGKNLREE